MHNELIHPSLLLREAADAIPTALAGAELVLKERVILVPDDGKVE